MIRFCSTPVMPVVSSMVGGEKPSRRREVMRGAYSCHAPRRLARMSMRPGMSRLSYFDGRGVGGGRKGWYSCFCGCCTCRCFLLCDEGLLRTAEIDLRR